jgi:hypothetical protein
MRNGVEAVRLAERACHMTEYRKASFVGVLAAAYAEAGRYLDAAGSAQKAVNLAASAGDNQFAADNKKLLGLYLAGKAYHNRPAAKSAQK